MKERGMIFNGEMVRAILDCDQESARRNREIQESKQKSYTKKGGF
ncbi:hypothetical protein [Lonsdalea quercina]